MQWKFWRLSGPKRVPRKVGDALASRFHLQPEEISRLRLVDKAGTLPTANAAPPDDRPVRCIRIIDPSMIEGERLARLTYDDLKTGACRNALRFEGHIERDGVVHLADRRPPRKTLTPGQGKPAGASTATKCRDSATH
jgi:hypothetical protein